MRLKTIRLGSASEPWPILSSTALLRPGARSRGPLRIAQTPATALVNRQMPRGIWITVVALGLTSCATKKQAQAPASNALWTNAPVMRPSASISGRIDWVNAKARYVIISLPLGTMPSLGSRMSVYRAGLKVGEVKVSPPQQNNFTAADILAGECQIGDEVRSN